MGKSSMGCRYGESASARVQKRQSTLVNISANKYLQKIQLNSPHTFCFWKIPAQLFVYKYQENTKDKKSLYKNDFI